MYSVLRTFRDSLPVLLIPLAWIFSGLAVLGYVDKKTILMAHLVMIVFIPAFVVTAWNRMDRHVLRTWRLIMVVGTVGISLGIIGLLYSPFNNLLTSTSIVTWMFIPSVGILDTARRTPKWRKIFGAAGLLSIVATAFFVFSILVEKYFTGLDPEFFKLSSILLVAIGQSASIVLATSQD